MLRRNDLATITENEKTITNIKEIERVRSDELQKLRKQVEMFAYEQQGWARQREEMATKIDHVQGKLITYLRSKIVAIKQVFQFPQLNKQHWMKPS